MKNGGGMYVHHSANNAFVKWEEYNKMIGLGWRGADEGDALEIIDGKLVRIPSGEGQKTSHGPCKDIVVKKFIEHSINKDYPDQWKTTDLEVYVHARGLAENLQVLSYTYDEKTSKEGPIE